VTTQTSATTGERSNADSTTAESTGVPGFDIPAAFVALAVFALLARRN
jgi:hypothetical protein